MWVMLAFVLDSPETNIEVETQLHQTDPDVVGIGVVAGSQVLAEAIRSVVDDQEGNQLVFAVEDETDLPDALRASKGKVDVVVAFAEPGEDRALVPGLVEEVVGPEVGTVLEDFSPMVSDIQPVAERKPWAAQGFARVIFHSGVDPFSELQDTFQQAHNVAAQRLAW